MRLSSLLRKDMYRSAYRAEDVEINGVCEHTESIKAGNLFIARKGLRFDATQMLPTIEGKGASAVVLEDGAQAVTSSSVPCFYVKDIQEESAYIFSRFFGEAQKELCLIAVTGTNGKTTTAHMLAHILEHCGHKTGYIGTLGVYLGKKAYPHFCESRMTTPSPSILYAALRALRNDGCTHAVMEVSSHALAQKRTAPIDFALSVFTNLSEDHLDFHKTMEEYYQAKKKLFDQSRLKLINIDDAYGERLFAEASFPKCSYAVLRDADNTITDLNENDPLRTKYTYRAKSIELPIDYPLSGSFNIYNALAAVSAAALLGERAEALAEAMHDLHGVPGRMERIDLPLPFSVIIDYAHTPDAIKQCILSARRFTKKRVIVLFGAGGEREKEKRAVMGAIAEKHADFVFVTADNSRSESTCSIIKDILRGMKETHKRRVICNRKKAICEALSYAREGDTVLLLGKGHECYMIGKNGTEAFSEKEIILDFLKEKGIRDGV